MRRLIFIVAAAAAVLPGPAKQEGALPADAIEALIGATIAFHPKSGGANAAPGASFRISPEELVEVGQAFAAALEVIGKSGERRAAYLAKLKAQGIEEEPMSDAGIAFEVDVLGNRFTFDKYGYLHFDDRFVQPGERPALKKIESLYIRFHKRWMAESGRKKDAIVDRAAEWRVRKVPVFKGFEDDRYQEHDALIVRCVEEFNRDRAAGAGATADQARRIPALTTAIVKSHMIEETGGRDAKSLAAWQVDPQQVNVPGDWSDAKKDLGISKPSARNQGTPEQNIKAAIRFLARKGFGASGMPASKRPSGTFDGWQTALRRYNGRKDAIEDGRNYSETYAAHIIERAKDPSKFVAIRKKVKK